MGPLAYLSLNSCKADRDIHRQIYTPQSHTAETVIGFGLQCSKQSTIQS